MAVVTAQSVTEVLGRVLSVASHHYTREISDAAFNKFSTWNAIYPKTREYITGGTKVRVPVELAKPAKARAYSGTQSYDYTLADTRTAMEFPVVEYIVGASWTLSDLMAVRAPQGIIDLARDEIDKHRRDLIDTMQTDLITSAGTDTAKLVGMALAIDDGNTTGTYGGVSRSSNSAHQNVATNQAATSANVLADMRTSYTSVSDGTEEPNLIISGRTPRNVYESKLTPTIRVDPMVMAQNGPGGAAIRTLVYGAANYVVDPDFTGWGTGTLSQVMLNLKHWHFKVRQGMEFVTRPPKEPVGQTIIVQEIVWHGCVYTDEPRRNAVLYDFATS